MSYSRRVENVLKQIEYVENIENTCNYSRINL